MAITKKTVIDQIEWTRGGSYQIRFALLIDEDGTDVEKRWHRTMVWNSGEVDATMDAVNADLARMKYDTLGPGQIARIRNIIAAVDGVVGVKQPPPPPTPAGFAAIAPLPLATIKDPEPPVEPPGGPP